MNLSKCTTGEISEAIQDALNSDDMDVIVNELLELFKKGENKTLHKLIIRYFNDETEVVISDELQKLRDYIMQFNLHR